MTDPCTPHCPAGDCAGCAFPPIRACMGGWCARRDRCASFHAADRREPAERLCEPGDFDQFRRVGLTIAPPVPSIIPLPQLAELVRTHAFPEAA